MQWVMNLGPSYYILNCFFKKSIISHEEMGTIFSIIENTKISIELFKILKRTDFRKTKRHLKIKESLIFPNNPKSHIKFTNISVFRGNDRKVLQDARQ